MCNFLYNLPDVSAALSVAGCESAAHARVRLPFANVIIPMTVGTNIRNLDVRLYICLRVHTYTTEMLVQVRDVPWHLRVELRFVIIAW